MGKIAFLFSGQGAQYPGMMKEFYDEIDGCAQVFQTANKALNRSISNLCFSGSQEELNQTHNTQPCMLAADLAAYAAIKEVVKPDAAAGFSLGEYAALTAAGVMKIEDVFPLIQFRADCMQEAVPLGQGAMAALGGIDEIGVKELCDNVLGYVEPANFNCPGQIVVSGEVVAVEQLVSDARTKRIKAMMLPVSAPFHCSLMKTAAERLKESLENISFENPTCPVYMNVDALPLESTKGLKEKLAAQAMSPVYWEQTLKNMYSDGINIFIELGPGKTLSGFVKKTFKGIGEIYSLRISDMKTLEDTVNKLKEIEYGRNHGNRICTS